MQSNKNIIFTYQLKQISIVNIKDTRISENKNLPIFYTWNFLNCFNRLSYVFLGKFELFLLLSNKIYCIKGV